MNPLIDWRVVKDRLEKKLSERVGLHVPALGTIAVLCGGTVCREAGKYFVETGRIVPVLLPIVNDGHLARRLSGLWVN